MSHSSGPRTIVLDRLSIAAGSGWARLPWIAGTIGVVALAVSAWLGRSAPDQFFFSWLVAFLYFLSIALGGLFFVLVHYLSKAGWGVVVRRLAENTMATLPLFALLFVPIFLGIHHLFHWSHHDAVQGDALLLKKEPYLNEGFFTVRAAFYLICWSLIALWYARQSRRQDSTGDHAVTRQLTALAGPAVAIFAITVSFAAIDWIMSLDPHWYSTMLGVYYFSGCLVGFFGFLALLAIAMSRAGYLRGVVTVEHFHDLGKLLFAFTVFWSYIAFSQYFLIWYANIPEETSWFLHRAAGDWKGLSLLLGFGHFAVPFLLLMPRTVKRRAGLLAAGATWMLLMHLVDIYWLVMPTLHHEGVHVGLLDVTTLLAVGGLFLATLGWVMRRQALVPVRDPRFVESLSFQNM